MKSFVIGYISFFDDDLKLELVDGEDWRDAMKNSRLVGDKVEDIDEFDIEGLKQEFFDIDSMIEIKEVKIHEERIVLEE